MGKGRFQDISGQRFGYLVALGMDTYMSPSGHTQRLWKCRCDCGGIAYENRTRLEQGRRKSCGCRQFDPQFTHGMTYTRFYIIWRNMRARCDRKEEQSYPNYGGRGIGYDPRWVKFENFLADMAEGYQDDLMLDRIDSDADYCKANCRWATREEQANNRRNNIRFKVGEAVLTQAQLLRKYGMGYSTYRQRLKRGLTVQEIFGSEVSRIA